MANTTIKQTTLTCFDTDGSKAPDFSNTRCFIDADGTLFNSLVRYNTVIDSIFRGKYTDKPYEEYYQAFNDTYDIIPGSTWKTILGSLVEFLGYERLSDEEETALVNEFEEGAVDVFKNLSYEDFVIDPVIQFCRYYTDHGGEIVIHSGTNHRILETMLESAGITDLFKDYICADMLNVAPDKLGKWGYKTELLRSLQEKYPTNGRQDFVVGDTKGDCFGAYDCQMPFVLVWRGYPKNPYELHAEDENGNPFTIAPDMIIDMRQDEVVDVLGGKVECFETELNVLIENESEQMSDLVDWCTSRCMPIAREDQKFFQQIVK